MTKRLLLTGAGGFIGHHCLDYWLNNTDWEIICIDSFRHRGTCCRLTEISPNHRVKIFQHDLTVPLDHQLCNLIFDRKIDDRGNVIEKPIHYIVNMASESAVERSTVDPVGCINNNCNLVINMLEFARTCNGLERFIQISSDEVYGEAAPGCAHKEWAPIMPSNPYAASKAMQEAAAIAYWRTYKLPVIITNCANMIGERQDPEKFLPKIIQKISFQQEVPIYGNDTDIGSRIYMDVYNFAHALTFILGKKIATYHAEWQAKPDRYNICGDTELNNLELAQMVAEIMGQELRYKLIPSESARPGYDRRYALDGELLTTLGWRPLLTFRESLQRIVQFTLQNPHWTI